MKIYLQTALRSNSDQQDLQDLFERYGLSDACADLGESMGVYTLSEFRERSRHEIHVFETWDAENKHADKNAEESKLYEWNYRLLRVMREALSPNPPENMAHWRAHRDA